MKTSIFNYKLNQIKAKAVMPSLNTFRLEASLFFHNISQSDLRSPSY